MQDEFDRLFDAAFDEAAKRHMLAPSSDSLWEKTERALKRRRTRRRRLRSLPFVALSFVLGALLFGSPKVSDAFDPFFEKVKSFPEGVVRVIFGSDESTKAAVKPKTAPPPEFSDSGAQELVEPGVEHVVGAQTAQPLYTSWVEVQNLHDWIVPDSSTIPSQFQLKNIYALFDPSTSNLRMATGLYVTDEDSNFTIAIRKRSEMETGGNTYREEDGKLEMVKIGGREAYLFLTYDGYSSLEWRTIDWDISIVGKLDRESILAIGNGIK